MGTLRSLVVESDGLLKRISLTIAILLSISAVANAKYDNKLNAPHAVKDSSDAILYSSFSSPNYIGGSVGNLDRVILSLINMNTGPQYSPFYLPPPTPSSSSTNLPPPPSANNYYSYTATFRGNYTLISTNATTLSAFKALFVNSIVSSLNISSSQVLVTAVRDGSSTSASHRRGLQTSSGFIAVDFQLIFPYGTSPAVIQAAQNALENNQASVFQSLMTTYGLSVVSSINMTPPPPPATSSASTSSVTIASYIFYFILFFFAAL
uniref:Uncharacterized protein n=1 Tax=Polytomella parva TaxID=51329 RepID=A0A7S0V5Z1_9CHLO|mmetsp:Transcript_30638/g.55807  ORF Transcript_30638/g.55807 Transcript_30638/m.55807 type:complete len:265 (+) Transcript_30638:82-876(+)